MKALFPYTVGLICALVAFLLLMLGGYRALVNHTLPVVTTPEVVLLLVALAAYIIGDNIRRCSR